MKKLFLLFILTITLLFTGITSAQTSKYSWLPQDSWAFGFGGIYPRYLSTNLKVVDFNNVGGFVGKIIVPPVSIVNFEPELYDVDSDGYAAGTVYGDESYHLEGASITEYRWVKEDSLIGTGPELILSLPTGTHNFSLAIEDEYGLTDTFQFSINILVTKILTD